MIDTLKEILPDDDSVRRAKKLLDGLVAKDVPEEMKEELRAWFKSGVSEKEKYAALELLFRELEENPEPDGYDRERLEKIHEILGFPRSGDRGPRSPERRKERLSPVRRMAMKVAAVLIPAMLVIGGIYYFDKGDVVPDNTAEGMFVSVLAAAGEQKQIMLPDSSTVWLNGGSTIRYARDFNAGRTVDLAGEAYFSVRKAADGTEFTVKTEKLTVTVLGTEFNVRAYENEVETEVTLESGKIDVAVGGQKRVMKPLDRLVVDNQSEAVRLEEIGGDDGIVWRSGMEFRNTPVRDVLSAVALHFNMDLEVIGVLPDDNITFGFGHDASLELVLAILKDTHGYFSYEISGGIVKITNM